MKNIAIFISGRGSNLESILRKHKEGYFNCNISFVLSNKPDARGLSIANNYGIKTFILERKNFESKEKFEEEILNKLNEQNIDLIVLAGFMMILSKNFVNSFGKDIINIHPSLLPAFPGVNSQKRALDYGVKFSGCTVHFVTEEVDGGPIILQEVVPCFDDDSEESLSERILEREHFILPYAIKLITEDRIIRVGRRVFVKNDKN
ncbi:MAG: phosphoribosylglycinamide formyltransferase [Caldisericia bacterium]|jgi:phosphoribosylglycinamide formyltransferase-1|nr:phosphoribosylglycinamide formyltransferase [Caldisericia bacterium]MDD5689583.1 phosphoribosylglycinamide formyltransferase [Caldisericia bacterium]HOJ16412.1 phosphoribosylglycinamide formyltransferase [Caldisericia bacterium]HOW03205.1 phosphoribosylglycinamide formyltransferase [Caldisericia bacterium]